MHRDPPKLTPEEALAQMMRWATDLEGLELLRRALPEGATLDDALSFHRRLHQKRRQPSRVMQEDESEP